MPWYGQRKQKKTNFFIAKLLFKYEKFSSIQTLLICAIKFNVVSHISVSFRSISNERKVFELFQFINACKISPSQATQIHNCSLIWWILSRLLKQSNKLVRHKCTVTIFTMDFLCDANNSMQSNADFYVSMQNNCHIKIIWSIQQQEKEKCWQSESMFASMKRFGAIDKGTNIIILFFIVHVEHAFLSPLTNFERKKAVLCDAFLHTKRFSSAQ